MEAVSNSIPETVAVPPRMETSELPNFSTGNSSQVSEWVPMNEEMGVAKTASFKEEREVRVTSLGAHCSSVPPMLTATDASNPSIIQPAGRLRKDLVFTGRVDSQTDITDSERK